MDMSLFTSFEGRINRAKWWLGLVILIIVQWIVWYVVASALGVGSLTSGDPAQIEQAMSDAWLPIGIVALLLLYPSLALYTKRWHDRGKSGWWTLIGLVPVIGGIWILIELGILAGTSGPNQYGPDPLGGV
jgi:uncharacterized membrane protein YhaH (DUF805 family)